MTTHSTKPSLSATSSPIEVSLPAACSLLSLRNATNNNKIVSPNSILSNRSNTSNTTTTTTTITTTPDHSSPSSNNQKQKHSSFWQTVLADTPKPLSNTPSSSSTFIKNHSFTPIPITNTPTSQHSLTMDITSNHHHHHHRQQQQQQQPQPQQPQYTSSNTLFLSTDDESSKMNIPCVLCGVRFRKPGHLHMHWRGVHATSSDSVYPAKIEHLKIITTPVHQQQHNQYLSPILSTNTNTTSIETNRKNRDINKSGRAYGCPQCDARFRRGSDRNRHMRMVHAKIRPFECKLCGNHFGRKSFLEAHILTVHQKLRPFRCECGAAFGQRSSLTRHTRKIHGREP